MSRVPASVLVHLRQRAVALLDAADADEVLVEIDLAPKQAELLRGTGAGEEREGVIDAVFRVHLCGGDELGDVFRREDGLLLLVTSPRKAGRHRRGADAEVFLGKGEDGLEVRLRPVGGVVAALLDNRPMPHANAGCRQVGELDVAQKLEEACALRYNAALGVVRPLLPRADQQRATDRAVRHHLIALQRGGLDLPLLVGKPMIDGLANGRGRPLVDVAALSDLHEQGVPEGLGVFLLVEGAAATLARLRIAILAVILRV